MNIETHTLSLRSLVFQRNAFLGLSVVLSISLIIISSFLFLKSEKIIIVPPVVEKEFWIDSKSVSPSYLEQYAFFFAELLLTKSSQSASMQRSVILRHADPSFSTSLNKKLIEEEQKLAKENASYVFYPLEVHVDASKNEVLLKGERTTYVSGKTLSTDKESYLLQFKFHGSKLWLSGITEK